ncbi:hypothetical protein BFW87_12025 [Pseudomonas fluorescens]|uniref:YjiS-like domain-containing protein n=1 Tax=Pseudomonas fluorescens TaxID=294 RepID=A0A1T2YYU4_PSEFL|nr:DUF1127 domain-containing protein [Pseudomonas fluorescens]OPA97037.1 hypothetical protein BFW87_12025 [Pseudomonas fluorescens]
MTTPLLLPRLLGRAARVWLRWVHHAHERRQLAQLNPRELSDAGITSGERTAELSKPFWRD